MNATADTDQELTDDTNTPRYVDPKEWDFRGQHAVYDNPELSGIPIDFIDHKEYQEGPNWLFVYPQE